MWFKVEETFFTQPNLDYHYGKHVAKPNEPEIAKRGANIKFLNKSKEEYDNDGDKLSKQFVRTSEENSGDRFVGFVRDDGRIVKYDTLTHEFVVYMTSQNNSQTVTYFKQRRPINYAKEKQKHYVRDITIEDDLYNK